MNQYKVKTKYTKELEDGTLKAVTEDYLLLAVNFTEAEAKAHEKIGAYVRGEFIVKGISKLNYENIIVDDKAYDYYESKVEMRIIDADSGKEKKQTVKLLLEATGIHEACTSTQDYFLQMDVNCRVKSISLTTFQDVIID